MSKKEKVSRRGFIKMGSVGTVAVAVSGGAAGVGFEAVRASWSDGF